MEYEFPEYKEEDWSDYQTFEDIEEKDFPDEQEYLYGEARNNIEIKVR